VPINAQRAFRVTKELQKVCTFRQGYFLYIYDCYRGENLTNEPLTL